MNEYYVYVYIHPRNYEEFYYGKGKGSRKEAHLDDKSDSAKRRRISDIKREGLSPIIRVIARDLTEDQAYLIEKTLLWKLGRWTTNVSSGRFRDKFRPHDTMHIELPGFDFKNGLYYYNVGEGVHRNWDDYCQFGFISAGQGKRWRDAMLGYFAGDVFAAYLKRHGYVGIGRIVKPAKMIRDVRVKGRRLLDLKLRCRRMSENSDNIERSEYVCLVKWLRKLPREKAVWRPKPKLYTTTHVRASLEGQPDTVAYLEDRFGVELRKIMM